MSHVAFICAGYVWGIFKYWSRHFDPLALRFLVFFGTDSESYGESTRAIKGKASECRLALGLEFQSI